MSFVDLVPLFRRLGCEILEKQIHLVKVDLFEQLDQANGFQYTEQKRFYDNSSNAISQAVIVLAAVRTVWQPVLSTSVWEFVIGNLVEAVVKRLIDEVLAFDDISVGEGELLRKLMLAALESMSSLFGKEIRELEGGAGNQSTDLVRKWVPSWRKLERLTDLLDMSLRPISQSWESGDLSSCGFSADEVQHLIKAIFSETPLRTECLKLIVERDFKEQDL
jgi:centromere/kinetochore protein ZW10